MPGLGIAPGSQTNTSRAHRGRTTRTHFVSGFVSESAQRDNHPTQVGQKRSALVRCVLASMFGSVCYLIPMWNPEE